MMQIQLGQAPSYVWIGVLILLLAVAAAVVIYALSKLTAVRGNIKVALAALKAKTEKSTPSKRTASK